MTVSDSNIHLIAVMGVTGSGKSNFIRHLTGDRGSSGPVVGVGLEACTSKTTTYECIIGDQQFVFFDTPGFDDTYRGDGEILVDISQALCSSYRNNVKLTGIVYLHRIKDERMTNAIMRNLSMFRSLCGEGAFKNVVLATTFWDEIPTTEIGEFREKQLAETKDWWGYMISRGSRIHRFLNSRESALHILADLVTQPNVTLQIQREIVDEGLGVNKTTAGVALNKELAEVTDKFEQELEKLRLEKEKARREHDDDLEEILDTMQSEKEDIIAKVKREQDALNRDHREQEQRMEDAFKRQISRLRAETQQRQTMILKLESKLSQERAESDRRFQDAMSKSDRVVSDLQAQITKNSAADQKRFTEAMKVVEEQQQTARRAKDEVDRLTRELHDAIHSQSTGGVERLLLEQRIADLEAQRSSSQLNFWSVLETVAGIVLPGVIW